MRRQTILAAAGAGAAMAALLAGCAAPASPATAPLSTAPPTPVAGALATGLMRTKALGTATASIDASAALPGGSRTMQATGAVGVDRGTGSLTWTLGDGSTVRHLRTAKGLFVQGGGPGGWVLYADPGRVPAAAATDPLRGLGLLQDVSARPTSSGTVVSGRLPATADSLRLVGLSDPEIAALAPGWQGRPVEVEVGLDGSGRVVRVERRVRLPDGEAWMRTDLGDFRVPLNLTTPASGSVTATR